MEKTECKHNWIDNGAYMKCFICGEIKWKYTSPMNGFICDDLEMGNYRFYQSEDVEAQTDVLPQNEKRD